MESDSYSDDISGDDSSKFDDSTRSCEDEMCESNGQVKSRNILLIVLSMFLVILISVFSLGCVIFIYYYYYSEKSPSLGPTKMKEISLRTCFKKVKNRNIRGICDEEHNIWLPGQKQKGFISHPEDDDDDMNFKEVKIIYDPEHESLVSYIENFFEKKWERQRKREEDAYRKQIEREDDENLPLIDDIPEHYLPPDEDEDKELYEGEGAKPFGPNPPGVDYEFIYDCEWACKSYETGEEIIGEGVEMTKLTDTGLHGQIEAYEDCKLIADDDCSKLGYIPIGVAAWQRFDWDVFDEADEFIMDLEYDEDGNEMGTISWEEMIMTPEEYENWLKEKEEKEKEEEED